MKTKLLFILMTFFAVGVSAQTTYTYNFDWFAGIGSSVDRTIEVGDTVTWTWTSPNHSVENDPAGTSVESFDSGVLFPSGSTFSYTFTTLGSNDYYCVVHGSGSMSGTITVVAEGTLLSSDEFDKDLSFTISPNPAKERLNIDLNPRNQNARLEVYNVLGKRIISKEISGIDTSVNVSSWNNGIYIVRVSSGDLSETKRFVKQ